MQMINVVGGAGIAIMLVAIIRGIVWPGRAAIERRTWAPQHPRRFLLGEARGTFLGAALVGLGAVPGPLRWGWVAVSLVAASGAVILLLGARTSGEIPPISDQDKQRIRRSERWNLPIRAVMLVAWIYTWFLA